MHITPAFSQGTLEAKKLGSTSAAYGYYEYLPNNYDQKSKHPVIIFLSGIGEKGNGTTELDKVLKHGPPKLIKNGSWPSSRPFIVLVPQSASGFPSPDELHSFISYIIKTYKVDASRIYLTGLSAGGVSIWKYLKIYQDQIAAAIPICGNGQNAAKNAGCSFKHIPIWAFHGSSDPTIHMNGSINAVATINACVPKPNPLAKVTIYPGVGHDAWSRTYDLSGMNTNTDSKYDPYNKSIYDWMLSYSRDGLAPPPPTNQPPVANAGDDVPVSESTSNVVLNGSNSYDSDGNIVSYAWTKTSGPSASLSGAGSSQLTVTNLSAGTYNFKLTVKDDDGASGSDEVMVTVSSTPPPPSGNNGVSYVYYEGSWNVLPDFSKLKVIKSGQVSNFSLSPRNKNDNFGFRFDSFLYIDKAGDYTFYTTSDDGSKLYINGKIVVNNDGVHSSQERSGKITLSVGYHAIKVKYFEKSSQEVLSVKYAGPGISKQNIPDNKLFISKEDAPPSTTPPTSGGAQDVVTRFYLVNPSTNNRIGELKAGGEIVVGSGINIEAITDPGKVGSIKFLLNNTIYSVESAAPYAMGGDSNGNFGTMKLAPGNYTLKAIPYSEAKAKGQAGQALEMKFTVVKGSSIGINARVENIAENAFYEKPVGGESQGVSVYPNPVEDRIHIQFTKDEVGTVSCKLLNYTGAGHEVSVEHAQFTDGVMEIDVSQWNLSAGIYLLQVSYNQGVEQKVFRIIKK